MWKSIVGAWLNVKSGLTKSDPTIAAEILKQSLFGNLSILNVSGTPLGVSGLSEGCAFAHSGCSRVKDLWNPENKNWRSLSELGMSRHASNRRCWDIITASIPWCPDEHDSHIQVGDWIGNPTPGTGNPLDWVYLVLAHTRGKDLSWDPGEWHWRSNPPLGDAPFFGYTAKRGYVNTRKTTRSSNMVTFIQGLNLRNTSSAQMIARLWHNACPRKVGMLIWLTLNQGLPMGTWLQLMGIAPQCKVCDSNAEESP
ncbi:unnamed protein product [Sphagnum balticum]